MFGETISFGEGLLITALGMGVTFAALIALSFMLDLLRILFYKDPNKNKAVEVKEEPAVAQKSESVEEEQEDEELIAVISAAIAASLNTSTHNIIVRNITRVADSSPAWNKAGRLEQMNRML